MFSFQLTEEEYRAVLAWKRDFHMHPELSLEEFRTTEKIKEILGGIDGVEILDLPVPTGVLAQIRSGEGPEVLLRADIDALPQTEQYESPWKSQNEGVMHACGHDFHTASLLGAALILSRAKKSGHWQGTADLLFQCGEEGTHGARKMIEAGLFAKVHPMRCFGMHNWPSVPSGAAVCTAGARMSAKRNFVIELTGAGGHGSMPHLNIDPIVCAAAVIQSLQTVVSRNMDPLDAVVLSINHVTGGSPVNLVVDCVTIRGTVRSLSDAALDRAVSRVEEITANTAAAYECGARTVWDERVPAVVNTEEMAVIAGRCAQAAGCTQTAAEPSLASEDFSLYGQQAPSYFYWVGTHREGEPVEDLHRPNFHTDDEALRQAAALYAASAVVGGQEDPA